MQHYRDMFLFYPMVFDEISFRTLLQAVNIFPESTVSTTIFLSHK